MASLENIWPFILKMEGGYVNNPHDHGGPTKYGVTLSTWKELGHDKDGDGIITENDIKLLTVADAHSVAQWFWNYFKCDLIPSQEIANLLYDWGWASGVALVTKRLQGILGLAADGIFGSGSLAALNARIKKHGAAAVFEEIKQTRFAMIKAWVDAHPDQHIFIDGWKRRINLITPPQKKSWP
jgi:lysozyme family protein